MTASNPTPADISAARERGKGVVLHTPVIPSAYLSQRFGGKIVLKAENLQRTGAFKIRGAMNKLSQLGNAKETGVVVGVAEGHAGFLCAGKRGGNGGVDAFAAVEHGCTVVFGCSNF